MCVHLELTSELLCSQIGNNLCGSLLLIIANSSSTTDPQHHTMQPLWPEVSLYASIMSEVSTTMLSTAKLQEQFQELYLSCPEYNVLPVQGGDGLNCTITNAGRLHTGAVRVSKEDTKESTAAEAAVQLLNNLSEF